MPNGATSGVSDSIQPSTPNLAAAYALQNSWPTMPAVDEIVTTRPERWARMIGSTARVTFNGPNRVVSICARKSVQRPHNCPAIPLLACDGQALVEQGPGLAQIALVVGKPAC